MYYPLLIIKNEAEGNYQLTVPDIVGCKAVGKTVDAVLNKASEVISDHLSILAEYGEAIPHAKPLDLHLLSCTVDHPVWAMIDFDISPYLGKSQKINVTLPELLIKRIDDRVNKSAKYKTRSGFIATACMTELTEDKRTLTKIAEDD
jgi:predicted RNase H-like HicB family nuclease